MREIKFRCYDKEEGYMLPWEHLVEAGDLREMLLYGHEEDEKYSNMMQFTGLKDKNGNEIFEGDIVKTRYSSFSHSGWDAVVKFGKYGQDGSGDEYNPAECFGVFLDAIDHESEDEDGYKRVDEYLRTTSPLEFEEIIVIGNIYENPELLKEDSQ